AGGGNRGRERGATGIGAAARGGAPGSVRGSATGSARAPHRSLRDQSSRLACQAHRRGGYRVKSVTAAALCALVCSTLACTKIVKVPDPQPGGGGGNGGNGGMGGQGGIGGAGRGTPGAPTPRPWDVQPPPPRAQPGGRHGQP